MNFITNNIWFILFIAFGLPLGYYRNKFRKTVYQTDNWVINIKPIFWKEIKGIFGNIYTDSQIYKRLKIRYILFMNIYILLTITYFVFNTYSEKMNKIEVGSQIPLFELNDQHGESFNIETVLGKKNLVIYFYPKDDSPGCTKEACSFRDQFEVFADADAIIIGISAQSVNSHLNFAQKHGLNYTLLSDEGNLVRKLFGVPSSFFGLIPGRVTYIVNKEGEVVYLFNSQIQVDKHVNEALRIIREMK